MIYEVEAGGKSFEVEAPNIKRAESAARLYVARLRMTEGATAGAQARSEVPAKPQPSDPAFYGDPNSVEAIREASRFSADVASAGPQLQMLGAGAGVGAAGGVLPFARGAALGVAGGFAGRKAAEAVGAPGWVGATAGALAAPVYGPKLVAGMLSGKAGLLTGLLQRIVPAAEQKAATVAAKGLSGPAAERKYALELAKLADRRERTALMKAKWEAKGQPAKAATPAPADPSATMPPTPASVSSLETAHAAQQVTGGEVARTLEGAVVKNIGREVRLPDGTTGKIIKMLGGGPTGRGVGAGAASSPPSYVIELTDGSRTTINARALKFLPPATTVPPLRPAGPADTRTEQEQIVSMVRFLRRTDSTARAELNEYLKGLPPETASQVRLMLAKGVDKPATTFSKGGIPGKPGGFSDPKALELSAELARMLGQ